MKKVLKWLDKNMELSILCVLLASIVVVMLYQIIRRYVFNSSLSWSEEFCRYCFIWFMFIATSYSIRLRSDLRVDTVVSLLPERSRKVIDMIDLLIGAAMIAVLFVCSFKTVGYMKSTNETSTGLHLPMYFVYMAMPVGFGMSTVRYIQRIIADVKAFKGKEEKEA